MSRVLLFSDLHLHAHKKSSDRLQDCINVLKWVFDTAISRGVEDVLFLGDLFHDRSRIEVRTLHRVIEVFSEYFRSPKFRLRLLIGNHDMWSRERWDYYSPSVVGTFPNVEIIDSPRTLEFAGAHWDFLPYTEHPIEDLESLAESPSKILLSHLSVDGAILNSYGSTSDVVIEHDGDMVKVGPKYFSPWKKVFLGHYHTPHRLGDNIEYVGSPLQLSFGEAGQSKHLILFDPKTFKSEYIVNDFSPKHIVVDADRIDGVDFEGNFVHVRMQGSDAAKEVELRKRIGDGVGSLKIEPIARRPEEVEAEIVEAKSILEGGEKMIRVFVDAAKTLREAIEKQHGATLDAEALVKFGCDVIKRPIDV